MHESLETTISSKISFLNDNKIAVIYVLTGSNGSGKSVLEKKILNNLPFHQTFNLGAVTKTIRFMNRELKVTSLENFEEKRINELFTPIVQFSCEEYMKNGVNVIIDGVQINTSSPKWKNSITGGAILRVTPELKLMRGSYTDTHFNRRINTKYLEEYNYRDSRCFITIDNNGTLEETYKNLLESLNELMDLKLKGLKDNDNN